jgi:protein TonB
MVTLGTVAAIHVVGIYALVHGLGGVIVNLIKDPHLVAQPTEVMVPIKPLPTPQPQMKQPLSEPVTTSTTQTTLLRPTDTLPMPQPTADLPTAGPSATPSPVDTTPPVPQVHHVDAIGARPMGKPGAWATTEDYPSLDLNAEHEGVTHFSLSIDTAGRVSGCTVTASSGWPGLDNATCRLIMKRARFSPAADENGQPTTGAFASAIRWTIPR